MGKKIRAAMALLFVIGGLICFVLCCVEVYEFLYPYVVKKKPAPAKMQTSIGKLAIGMKEFAVIKAIGRECPKNTTVHSNMISEQWMCPSRNGTVYLYFRNGVLTSWQDTIK